jgi:hypothetical protein
VNDGDIFTQQPNPAAGRDHEYVTDLAGCEIADHVLFGKQATRFVILNVVVGEDAGQFGGIACNQRAVALFEEFQNLLFVVVQKTPIRNSLRKSCRAVARDIGDGVSVQAIHFKFANLNPVEAFVIALRRISSILLFAAVILPAACFAQSTASDKPLVVEYYYKTKWGHADEFLKLFKKNHYPLLRKEVEMGRMNKIWMDVPRYHTTEDGRWDYRVTIVFKNATVANEAFDEDGLKKQLWPDQETYLREEQRRFEILDSHWDLPVKVMELEAKP